MYLTAEVLQAVDPSFSQSRLPVTAGPEPEQAQRPPDAPLSEHWTAFLWGCRYV